MNKPPLGIKPEHLAIEERIKEIQDAITRYREAKVKIPLKWIHEKRRLRDRLWDLMRESSEDLETES